MGLIPGGGRAVRRAAVVFPDVPFNIVLPVLSISTTAFSGNVGTWVGDDMSYSWQIRDADDDSIVTFGVGELINGSGTFSGDYYLRVTATNTAGSAFVDSIDKTATEPASGLDLYGGGDPDFGLVTLRHQRYNDEATMLADINGTNPTGRTTWDAVEGAVKLDFPSAQGTLNAQLRYTFNDGGASRLEVFLQVRHGDDWINVGPGVMPSHKSLQLAVAGSPIAEQRFTTRDRYYSSVQGDGAICYVDVRDVASVGAQPKGPSDGLQTPAGGDFTSYRKQKGLWYLYQWAIDYGADSRAYSLSVTEEGGFPVKIYDQQDLPNWDRLDSNPEFNLIAHINEFWVEYNSSQGSSFAGPGTIHVKDLRVHY